MNRFIVAGTVGFEPTIFGARNRRLTSLATSHFSKYTTSSSPGGERGIRTLEASCLAYTLSKRAPSTTRTPLQLCNYYIKILPVTKLNIHRGSLTQNEILVLSFARFYLPNLPTLD